MDQIVARCGVIWDGEANRLATNPRRPCGLGSSRTADTTLSRRAEKPTRPFGLAAAGRWSWISAGKTQGLRCGRAPIGASFLRMTIPGENRERRLSG